MSDKTSFIQLSRDVDHLSFLKEMPEITEDEHKQFEQVLHDLVSRQASKFDGICHYIKECETRIDLLDKEMKEIKKAKEAWERNKKLLTDIIKYAYQQELITNSPTGNKYQATVAKTQSKLIDNFEQWEDKEIQEYGLKKTTTISRLKDDQVLEVKEEQGPDKDRLRKNLKQKETNVPVTAELRESYRFSFKRRERLTSV